METKDILAMMLYKSLSEAERKRADAYAGPGESFPLYANGEHLAAAWDLAGHADNPAEVRARIRAFAKEHGLEGRLPASANADANTVKKAVTALILAKARTSDIASLLEMAWHHEAMEGDKYQQADLAHWAKMHGMTHLLPSSAHTILHDENIVHEHDGVTNDTNGMHEHMIAKAFPGTVLIKALTDAPDSPLVVEGWVSTPDEDWQRDVVLPEAFMKALPGYASVGMPLTTEHQMFPDKNGLKRYPVGHGQRIAIYKAGQVVAEATHPTDAAEFENIPAGGDGVWGRFLITEQEAGGAVRKGNVRGFSFIAVPGSEQPRSPKGRLITEIRQWAECTIAAFPVNQSARILAAH